MIINIFQIFSIYYTVFDYSYKFNFAQVYDFKRFSIYSLFQSNVSFFLLDF